MGKKRCSKHKIQASGKSKRDTGALQCPVADACCLLLHINLGRQNTAPHGSQSVLLRRRHPLMPVSPKHQQHAAGSPGMAGQPNVKRERW